MSLREKKIQKKKQDIIKSAISIVSEKGYHATTMEEIAAQLLMTKGSVYYYFKDKQDLVYQSQTMLLEQSIQNIQEVINQDIPIIDKLQRVMIMHITFLISEKSGFAIGSKPEQFFSGQQLKDILALREKYAELIDNLIIQGIKEGTFLEVEVKIVRNIILGAMNWVLEWYSSNNKKNEQELAKLISEYLLRILQTNPIK